MREGYIVFILLNEQGKMYIGQTSDIEKRLMEHNVTGCGYTSKHRPWRLVHKEYFSSRSEAMSREQFLKTGRGRELVIKSIKGA